jgi:DNA invertase Pin-like site-specific DNA recombinase
MLFGFFAAMAQTERENIREATLEGLSAAGRVRLHRGDPPAPDHPHWQTRRLQPSPASIYRAMAE